MMAEGFGAATMSAFEPLADRTLSHAKLIGNAPLRPALLAKVPGVKASIFA